MREMKPRFNENKFGRLVKETWERYPAANGCTIHDCGDCFVVTNKNGTTIGQCDTMTEAETIAEMCSDEMKNKPFLVSEGNELTEDAILDAIPVDARDGLIDINEPDGSFGRYTWYVRFAPFSDEEAKEAADGIKNVTGRRTQVANFGREIYVVIMDYPSRPTSESKKLVKEGAGAGYTVSIKGLKFGKIIDYKHEKGEKSWEDSYKVKVEVAPGEYEIGAEDYYNDFFWQEHEFGDTPTAQIDGGYAIFDIALDGNPDEDDEALFQMNEELENRKLDISFDYGWGWTHANLPREEIKADHVDIEGRDIYFGIDKLVLNAPDLADAVNSGFQSTFDQGEEDEDGEPMDESYDPKRDDGRKRVMDALEEFRQVLWDDTKVDDEEEHDLRRSLYQDVDAAISQAIQKYFKYSRLEMRFNK